MTHIPEQAVQVGLASDVPRRWAERIGDVLAIDLSDQAKNWLQERVLGLGHGVELAHIRSANVSEATLGVYLASDVADESRSWLWLAVVIPEGNASRHLGWMAHLAACIRDAQSRELLRACTDAAQLKAALASMLSAARTHRLQHNHTRTSDQKSTHADSETGGHAQHAEHRMVVAILKEPEFVDTLLELFFEHDVRGSTILEARGMAEHLAAHMSLFAGFKSAFRAVGHSQVILTLVPIDRTDEVLEMVRIAAGGMETPGSGIAFAIDVPRVIGLSKTEAAD